jgi:hypothetical protein
LGPSPLQKSCLASFALVHLTRHPCRVRWGCSPPYRRPSPYTTGFLPLSLSHTHSLSTTTFLVEYNTGWARARGPGTCFCEGHPHPVQSLVAYPTACFPSLLRALVRGARGVRWVARDGGCRVGEGQAGVEATLLVEERFAPTGGFEDLFIRSVRVSLVVACGGAIAAHCGGWSYRWRSSSSSSP